MLKTMRIIRFSSSHALTCGVLGFLSLTGVCQAETLRITSNNQKSVPANSSQESELIQTVIRTSQEFKPVSQFRDVQPTDWAYMAVQSITQKYGCISGFPDNTFRGQQAVTRYQFAAGLNACLDKISELLTNGFADKVNKSDLNDLRKLQEEFATELAMIKGRVDALEAKTATLEAQQFSTTTKLYGQAILGAQGRLGSTSRFGANPATAVSDPATNITFGQQVQLSLVTQFPDRSILLTGIQAGNLSTDAPFTSLFALNNNFTRLGYEGNTNNTLTLSDLTYRFLAADKLAIVVGAKGISAVNIFRGPNRVESSGQGPVSVFAQRNPIIGFNSGDAGIGFDWQFNKRFSLQGVYSASNANDPNTGLFGGQYSAGIQLAANPSDNLDISFYYLNSYTNRGALNSPAGDNFIGISFPAASASKFSTNAFGSTISWALSRKFTLGGWVGFTTSAIQNSDFSGTVETLNWMTFSNFLDLFKEGDVLGLYVGQPPKIVSSSLSGNINFPSLISGTNGVPGGQNGTTTHIEAFYRFPLSRNITVTPGVIVILNPGNNPNSDTITIGVLRTTLTF
jgi:hypothetical protein